MWKYIVCWKWRVVFAPNKCARARVCTIIVRATSSCVVPPNRPSIFGCCWHWFVRDETTRHVILAVLCMLRARLACWVWWCSGNVCVPSQHRSLTWWLAGGAAFTIHPVWCVMQSLGNFIFLYRYTVLMLRSIFIQSMRLSLAPTKHQAIVGATADIALCRHRLWQFDCFIMLDVVVVDVASSTFSVCSRQTRCRTEPTNDPIRLWKLVFKLSSWKVTRELFTLMFAISRRYATFYSV